MNNQLFQDAINSAQQAVNLSSNDSQKYLAYAVGQLALAVKDSQHEINQKIDRLIQRQANY